MFYICSIPKGTLGHRIRNTISSGLCLGYFFLPNKTLLYDIKYIRPLTSRLKKSSLSVETKACQVEPLDLARP
jgi:hypothetical protein